MRKRKLQELDRARLLCVFPKIIMDFSSLIVKLPLFKTSSKHFLTCRVMQQKSWFLGWVKIFNENFTLWGLDSSVIKCPETSFPEFNFSQEFYSLVDSLTMQHHCLCNFPENPIPCMGFIKLSFWEEERIFFFDWYDNKGMQPRKIVMDHFFPSSLAS